jgi:uncharacterized membrane protein
LFLGARQGGTHAEQSVPEGDLMDMPLHPSSSDTAIRLTLTMLAGTVIGFNRGARGRAAGFRTTILVGLAASVAIQANILLSLIGKTAGSFAVMDLMRLPLGILMAVVKPRRLRCFPSSASERRQGLDRFQ